MSYRDETVRDILVDNVPCGWHNGLCRSGKPAVHVLLKDLPVAPAETPLCAYHSPFDVIADREAYDARVRQQVRDALADAIAFDTKNGEF